MEVRPEILKSCAALFAEKQVVELRVLDIKGANGFKYNAAGWFNDMEQLLAAVLGFEKKNPAGIYTTINPLHRACLARTNNKAVERLKDTSSDRDVIHRHWLPIDLDPVRPSGVSASNDELQWAKALAQEIIGYVEGELAFPYGLRAHSGNGIHLLYRVDLPNTDDSKQLLQECLASLALRFDNPHVKVDRTLFNASRILKLWGTVTRKGEHVEDRPHRRSQLWPTHGSFLEFAALKSATNDQLHQLALVGRQAAASSSVGTKKPRVKRAAKATASKTTTATDREHHFDVEAWMDRHKIAVVRSEPFDGTGVRYILEHCVFDSSHDRTSAILGRAPSGAIFYKCQHDSCSNRGWKEVKEHFKDPNAERRVDSGSDNPWSLANDFIDEEFCNDELGRVTLRRHREQYYSYSLKHHSYRPLSIDAMRIRITRWLGDRVDKVTNRLVADVMNGVSAIVTVPEEIDIPFKSIIDQETRCAMGDPQKRNWMTLANGILDLDRVLAGETISDCLQNHSAEWFSTTTLDFPFPGRQIDTECPTWLDFLAEILEDDGGRIAVIQEMFGYCFYRSTEYEKFFILQGRGNNGKSTILDVLAELLGDENVTSLSMDQLADPTMRFELYHKVANICSDLPEMDRVEEGLIKRVTSGEQIVANRKYKDPVRFAPYAKLIFSTNPLPRFADTSLGIWRRMIIIPFNYVVPNCKVDVHLLDKLRAELPAVLVWALEGAARLRANRGFSKSSVCEEANRDYRLTCFPVYTFLDECCNMEGEVKANEMWRTYRKWCRAVGLTKPKPLHSFVKDLIGFLPQIQYKRVRSGMLGEVTLHGISLRPNMELGDDHRDTEPPPSFYDN